MAPATATAVTPRASRRRRKASPTATSGPRQLDRLRAEVTRQATSTAASTSQSMISPASAPWETGTPLEGRVRNG